MLFPLDHVEKYLAGIFRPLERDAATLRWSDHGGQSALRVEALNTGDGELVISEVVTLTHRSTEYSGLSARACAELNRYAAMGVLMSGESNAQGLWISKIGIAAADCSAAERLYAPLLCGQATIMGWHSQCLARGRYQMDPGQSPVAGGNEPARVQQAEFAALQAMSNREGLVSSLQPGSYTVQFPWPDAVAPGSTSLLGIRSTEPHSLYGQGVLATLELPLSLQQNRAPELVDQLNRWELGHPELPPLLGAWCVGQRAPAFVSFVPTLLCVPGLVAGLAAWARGRHDRVCQWIEREGIR